MTESRTLQFESARSLQALYANDLKLLKTLEETLGVRVTTREGWLKVEGEPEQIERAATRLRATRKGPPERRRHSQARIHLRAQLRDRSAARKI